MTTLYRDAVDPETLSVTVTSSAFDLSTVSSADVSVKLPGGLFAVWDLDILDQSVNSLSAQHVWVLTDLAAIGKYVAVVRLYTPLGTRRCVPKNLQVEYIYK